MTAISVPYEQLDDASCRFPLARPTPDGVHRFRSAAEAARMPVAAAALAVPGIVEVVVSGAALTARKAESASWSQLAERVRYAVSAVESAGERPAASGGALDDDAMFDLAGRLMARDINPAVAKHGGKVELIDVQGGTVVVRMMGGCQGCGMASVTLKQGIESALRQAIPGLKGIRDVTDHASGTNPYFART